MKQIIKNSRLYQKVLRNFASVIHEATTAKEVRIALIDKDGYEVHTAFMINRIEDFPEIKSVTREPKGYEKEVKNEKDTNII